MRFKTILLAMVFLLILPVCAFADTNHLADFSDTAGHWALEPIMECKACGLINGYPGNVFKPGQSMSRVEALVLINKGLGWNKETATVSTAGIVFPSDLWDGFRADVTVAANKNLINKADIPNIKFNGAAPRVEVAVWLAKALNLKGTGSNLKFTDVDKIPAASKDMVAGVVEAGIITGLPGNLFDPNKSLTRAEMASIMSRLLKSGKMSPAEGTYVAGQVTAVNATNKSIVVKTSAGSATYILASSYAIYKDGKKMTSLDAIQVGNQVKMILNSAGNVVFLAYDRDSSTTGTTDTDTSGTGTSGGTSTTGSQTSSGSGLPGYVMNKYWDYFTVYLSDGYVEEINASYVKFTQNGAVTSYNSVAKGTPVEIVKNGNTINEVKIKSGSKKVFGTIISISSSVLELKDYEGKTTSYSIPDDVEVRDEDNRKTDLDELEEKQEIEVTLNNKGDIEKISMGRDSGEINGTVVSIKVTGNKKITIENEKGDEHTYTMTDTVSVRKGNSNKSLSDVEEKMEVSLILNSDDEVVRIDLDSSSSSSSSSTVSGEITDIKTSGTKKITIEKSNGKEVTYELTDDVTIKEGSSTKKLSYLDEGMDVKLTLNKKDEVTKIEIDEDSDTVSGEVTKTKTSGTKYIEIEKSNGKEAKYYLTDKVTIKEDGSTKSFSYIEEGMEVELTLNSNDEVTRIDIEDDSSSTISGEVTKTKTSGTKYIEIEKSNGKEVKYYLADKVTIKEDGSTKSFSYIEEGMEVELTLNSSDKVTRIDIEEGSNSTVKGEVTYIKTSGSSKYIEIEKSNGKEVEYDLASSVTVKKGSSTKSLSYVEEGMDVKLTLNSKNDVTKIEIE